MEMKYVNVVHGNALVLTVQRTETNFVNDVREQGFKNPESTVNLVKGSKRSYNE
jgi:hypothetical protein